MSADRVLTRTTSLWHNCSVLKMSKMSFKKIHQKTNAISKNKTDHQKVNKKTEDHFK